MKCFQVKQSINDIVIDHCDMIIYVHFKHVNFNCFDSHCNAWVFSSQAPVPCCRWTWCLKLHSHNQISHPPALKQRHKPYLLFFPFSFSLPKPLLQTYRTANQIAVSFTLFTILSTDVSPAQSSSPQPATDGTSDSSHAPDYRSTRVVLHHWAWLSGLSSTMDNCCDSFF